MKLIKNKQNNIDQIYSEMQKLFPKEELKPKTSMEKVFAIESYNVFDIYTDNDIKCGFLTTFEFDDNTILIDYLGIFKEFHSKGYGSETLKTIINQQKWKGCYLEVEKENINDINTTRRIKFYKNLGAQLLDINYLYPNNYKLLPMDLYYLPINSKYKPSKQAVLSNIKTLFDKIHFDIENIDSIYEKIVN